MTGLNKKWVTKSTSKRTFKSIGKYRKLMKTTEFSIFRNNNKDIEKVLRIAEFQIDKNDNILDKDKKPVFCKCCNSTIKKQNLGSIMRASPSQIFCDNPICFVSFVRQNKL